MSTRLASGGRLIDRRQRQKFQFNGRRLTGFAGDTLASALLANNQCLIGRSFKYHRRRGLVGSGPEEPNGLVGLGTGAGLEPNRQATMVELFDGLKASSQNHWPSLEFDIGALAGALPQLLPAGFYYKTFMQPRQAWKHLFEPVIRNAAGLGKAPREPDPDSYEHFSVTVDLLVIGGGIAGLTAAKAAAAAGARVLIVEQMPRWGGRSAVDVATIDGAPPAEWISRAAAELRQLDNVRMLVRTTLFGQYDHGFALALQRLPDEGPAPGGVRQRIWRIRAQKTVLAAGAIERPLCFRGNDIPGVMLASAVRDYVKEFAVSPGDRTVLAVNNDDAYRTAIAIAEAGLDVPAIVDSRPVAEGDLPNLARDMHIRVECGKAIAAVKGRGRMRGVQICSQAGEGAVLEEIECEAVAMSGGWSPTAHLWSHCRGKLLWDDAISAFRPNPDRPPIDAKGEGSMFAAGAAAGAMRAAHAVENTAGAVNAALKGLKLKTKVSFPAIEREHADPPDKSCLMPSGISSANRAKTWVDFQNDVKVADLEIAVREGYESSEHAKRYTTLGMATDQGKLSNVNGLMILAENLGAGMGDVSPTTFRPPYTPVTLGAIAGDARGRRFKPVRKTPIDAWHENNGTHWEPVSDWRRPYCYLNGEETVEDAVSREALRVRHSAGILDATTLGKILVKGPDAGKFLDLMYTNMMSTLRPGRCRYGLMCNENGFLMDDGVVARLDEETFLCHTTTGGADHIHSWMEDWLQCEWWNFKVYTANVTDHFAQICVAGPDARKILEKLGGMDVSEDALSFMAWKDGRLAGLEVRVFRISFSGELSFEIAIPAAKGMDLWEAVLGAGQEFQLEPYGTEALHVLRAEMGFIMIGDETDGTVTPQDLGLDWAISKKKKDYLGKRAQERPYLTGPDRWKFVGLETVEATARLPCGSHAVGTETTPHGFPKTVGRVTSSYHSPILNRTIALGLVERGAERMGEVLGFSTDQGRIDAKIVTPVFYDPEGTQTRG